MNYNPTGHLTLRKKLELAVNKMVNEDQLSLV